MNNILTEEEKNMPVTYGNLVIMLETLLQEIGKAQAENENFTLDAIRKVADPLIDAIHEIRYERIRDVRYFIELISNLTYKSRDALYHSYNDWCAEYDKLNKNKQEE